MIQKEVAAYQVGRWLWAIVAVAIALRVGAALYMGDQVQNLPGIFDQISYDRLAQNVVAGNGFSFDVDWWPATRAGGPTAHWSFLYTLYLAAVYVLVGHHPLVARLIQAVIAGLLMPLLTYRLAARVSNRKVGLIAAGISAIYVYFFYYAAALMTEPFFFLAILGTLNIALDLVEHPSLGRWAGLGLAAGCAVLLRQAFLLFVPVLFAWLWWTSKGPEGPKEPKGPEDTSVPSDPSGSSGSSGLPVVRRSSLVVGLSVTITVLAALITPWTIRNYTVFHQFVLLNTNAGYAFFWANHPIHGTNFISILGPEYPSYQELIPPELRHLDEAALDKVLLHEGLRFVVDDPVRYLLLSISRLKDHFLFWPKPESSTLSNISRVGSFGIFLPFMLYGLILSVFYGPLFKADGGHMRANAPDRELRTSSLLLLYLFIISYTLIHLLSWAGIRYRLPVDTVLVVFAAWGLHDLYLRLRNHYLRRLATAVQHQSKGAPQSSSQPTPKSG